MPKKLSYQYIKKFFQDNRCELLDSEYKNSRTKLRYRCSCGNESLILWSHFKSGSRCNKCYKRNLPISDVKDFFESKDCKLLSKEYINNREKLKYICNCGNISEITYGNFKNGQRCRKCRDSKVSEMFRHSYEFVENFFSQNGCTLLTKDYANSISPLRYICSCGKVSKTTFDIFKNGHRCKSCGIEKRSGRNAYQWNPLLSDEDRKDRRLVDGYKKWIKQVYQQNKWTCQKCENKKHINAHHIQNYASHPDLRMDIKNGITLCRDCHIQFHSIYGNLNNNKNQLDSFLGII